MTGEPKSDALRALYWREEILQVLFWLRGEGLGDNAEPMTLERFLGVEARILRPYLDRLVSEGLLRADGERYVLTEQGIAEGGRVFAEEFAELTRPGHGECGSDCWCHASPEEAEACHEERASGHSGR